MRIGGGATGGAGRGRAATPYLRKGRLSLQQSGPPLSPCGSFDLAKKKREGGSLDRLTGLDGHAGEGGSRKGSHLGREG